MKRTPEGVAMRVPSMYDLPQVMAESSYTEEQVFDLGVTNEISFLVVVPLIGACRVPEEALSHFMAGADEYTAQGMPEHYTGALSGTWKIKRDRLRILPESWEQYSDKAFEMVDALERTADNRTRTLPIGAFRLRDAAGELAKQFGWPDDATDTLISQWVNDAHDGSLTVRSPHTGIPCLPETSGVYGEFLTHDDVNVWAEKTGVLWRWSVAIAPEQSPATPAPLVAASDAPAIHKNQRPDLLAPLIEKAQRNEQDPFNVAVIWLKLCHMTESKTRPLIDVTSEGIKWTDSSDSVQFLTKKALSDRLRRLKKPR